MPQVKTGLVRIDNGSQTVRGSWTATLTGLAGGPYTADEVINFAPSSAVGRFIQVEANSTILRFIVTSGTPATGDVATGATSGANGTITSPIDDSRWQTSSVQAGDILSVKGDNVWYEVASVQSEHELTLSATYAGTSGTGKTFAISQGFTDAHSIPYPEQGDIETASLVKRAMQQIDGLLGGGFGRNAIINPRMQFWQRGTSLVMTSASDGFIADRWRIVNATTGTPQATISRVALAPGDVLGDPEFAHKINIDIAPTTGTYVFTQRIEDVRTFAGKTVTVSMWIKASQSRQFEIDFTQNFGSGGSANVANIGNKLFTVTTAWQRIQAQIAIPSVLGKTIGANSFVEMRAFPTGNVTLNLNWEITQVQVEQARTATSFERRPDGIDLGMCQRFYVKTYDLKDAPGVVDTSGELRARAVGTAANGWLVPWRYPVAMRATPVVTVYSPATGASAKIDHEGVGDIAGVGSENGDCGAVVRSNAATVNSAMYSAHAVANAEL